MNRLDQESGTIAWFVRNPVAANLVMILIVLGGIFSVLRIEKKTMPEMRANNIIVEVLYPQASPEEVERGVVIKIEEAIEEVEGIEGVRSRAYEGLAAITIEVSDSFPFSQVMDEVSFEVNAIFSFPEEAEKPVLRRAELEEDEVINIQITGELDERSMLRLFEEIREELLLLPQVSR
ncbi:MAG: efflux RND transporter permease subunit, partial [Verrucomicrobiota bacterium]